MNGLIQETDIWRHDKVKQEAMLFFYEMIDPLAAADATPAAEVDSGNDSTNDVDGGNVTTNEEGKVCQTDASKKRGRSPKDEEKTTPRQASSLKRAVSAMETSESGQKYGNNEKQTGGRRFSRKRRLGLHASERTQNENGQEEDGQEEDKTPNDSVQLKKLRRELATSNPGSKNILTTGARRTTVSPEIKTQKNAFAPATQKSLESFRQFAKDNGIKSRDAWRAWASSNREVREMKGWPFDILEFFKKFRFTFKPPPSKAASSNKSTEKSKVELPDEFEDDDEEDKLDEIDDNDSGVSIDLQNSVEVELKKNKKQKEKEEEEGEERVV